MKIATNRFSWFRGGLLLGTVFLVAMWLVKPAGVSTQFVVLDGIVWKTLSPDLITKDDISQKYSSTNAYLNKSGGKYASLVANPLNYGFIFVLSMLMGGFVSGKSSRKKVTALFVAGPIAIVFMLIAFFLPDERTRIETH